MIELAVVGGVVATAILAVVVAAREFEKAHQRRTRHDLKSDLAAANLQLEMARRKLRLHGIEDENDDAR